MQINNDTIDSRVSIFANLLLSDGFLIPGHQHELLMLKIS